MAKSPHTDKSVVRSNIPGLLLLSVWGTLVALGLSWALKKAYTKLFMLLLLALGGCAQSPSTNSECGYSKSKVDQIQQRAVDVESQFQIAQFHSHGTCLGTNQTSALNWYQKAANQLAVLYQWGIGVVRSISKVKWYQKAALQQHPLAEQHVCQLTTDCYSKSPWRAAVVLNSLRERSQREEDNRQRQERKRLLFSTTFGS